MAIQEGMVRIHGSAGDLTYYRRGNEYYVRLKSSLTAKKFWNHKMFEGSRQSCKRFAEGNQLASKVYRSLPAEKRLYALFCQLKTAAIHYLKLSLTKQEAYAYVLQHAQQEQFVLPNRIKNRKAPKAFPYAKQISNNIIYVPARRYLHLMITLGNEAVYYLAQRALYAVPLYSSAAKRFAAIA